MIGRWFLPQFDDEPVTNVPPPTTTHDPVTNVPPPTTTHDPDIDLFCAHHVQVADGWSAPGLTDT